MESISISKFPYAHQPLRSISFPPTKASPSSHRVEELLNKLKHHHQHSLSSNICLEAKTIQNDLLVLSDLYICMEKELFNSQQTQQALVHYQDGKLIGEALCDSVTLLDACESSRDLVFGLKEHMQTLQSAIRRRKGESSIESSVSSYENFRKNANKNIGNQLRKLKRMLKNKVNSFSHCDQFQDQNVVFLDRVLREASMITISILSCVLLFLSMPSLGTKGFLLMWKLKPKMFFSSEKEKRNFNGVEDLNNALCCLLGREKNCDLNSEGQRALRLLETLNISIDGLEGGLDCLFRCSVKNRVSFLNMLNH